MLLRLVAPILTRHLTPAVRRHLQEDIKVLLAYIVETFGDKLLDVTYVQTFRNLKQRYEQQQDRLQQRTAALERYEATAVPPEMGLKPRGWLMNW